MKRMRAGVFLETAYQGCKSQHYPGENPTIILVSKRFQSNLPARIIVVKGPV